MREITLLVNDRAAEVLGDALMDAGALSVSIEDADADTPDEQPLYGEPGLEPTKLAWKNSYLKVLVNDDFDFGLDMAIAVKGLGIEEPKVVSDKVVEDADWVRITQAQFQPVRVSDRLWIVPTWHEPPAGDTAINIRLDPGVAFGTGSHPTTHLCLQWLDANVKSGESVLDYGCGTGILAIAAKKLGAGEVLGTDIDPQAVEAAIDNAKSNDAPATFVLPKDMPEGTFDIVVANILADVIIPMAPVIPARLKKGGYFITSGIIDFKENDVKEAIEKAGLEVVEINHQGEWVNITARKPE